MQRASAESIIALPKWAEPAEEWRERPSGMKAMAVGILDADGAEIRGLSIEILAQAGRTAKRRKIVFGLFRYEVGVNERVYQLQLYTPSRSATRMPVSVVSTEHMPTSAMRRNLARPRVPNGHSRKGWNILRAVSTDTIRWPLPDPFEFRLK